MIGTLGEFANNLPDYQKIEIMMFILGKVPQSQEAESSDPRQRNSEVLLQHILLKSLLTVSALRDEEGSLGGSAYA